MIQEQLGGDDSNSEGTDLRLRGRIDTPVFRLSRAEVDTSKQKTQILDNPCS